MNNGRPPYGNTPVWGQQAQGGQPGGAQGGYPPQQPLYNQYPQGYGPQGYPQQTGYAQPGYPAPQGQPPVYPPQTGYGQVPPQPQQAYPPQQTGYAQPQPQPQPQPQAYPPQRQTYQQPYPPAYTQAQAQPQAQMYQGYQPARRRKITAEQMALMVFGGLLPVTFILGMALPGAAALKWVYVVLAVAAIGFVWARDAVKGSLKLTLTLIVGALAVIALVSALSGAPADQQNPGGSQTGQSTGGQGDVQGGGADDLVMQPANQPTESPAPTDAPVISDGAAQEQLGSFLYFWSLNLTDMMVPLTLPSWQRSVEEPTSALYQLLVNRIPLAYEILNVTGTDQDSSRSANVRMTIDHRNGRSPEIYIYTVVLGKEDGIWYVDPKSLSSNARESATPEVGNATPTQPPQNTSYPGMILYYNPQGGTKYHLDENCGSTDKKYLPFKGSFTWEQVNNELYSGLKPCSYCGAPQRGK